MTSLQEVQSQSQNEGLHVPIEEFQYAQFVVREKSIRPPFREWLLSLERYPHLLFWTEKKLLDIFWCQHTLLLWKLRAYPDPGEWPVDMATFQQSSSWDVLS